MLVQVQLYSREAKDMIGRNAETGYVHTFKNNKRIEVPVYDKSVQHAINAIEWVVKGIIQNDFPMRACPSNINHCDYIALCKQKREDFKRNDAPPTIITSVGEKVIAALKRRMEIYRYADKV